MNAELLKELVDHILEVDADYDIQVHLDTLASDFAELVGNLGNSDFQNKFAEAQNNLKRSLSKAEESFAPHEWESLSEISGTTWFSSSLIRRIQRTVQENSVTPSVALKEIQRLNASRANFLNNLKSLTASLGAIGVEKYAVSVDAPEIGFEIPRSLFDDELKAFQKELRQIYVIVKTFQKSAGEPTDTIELRTLSTTDPLVLLGVGWLTLKAIGQGVTWALDTIQKIQQIRSAREEASKIPSIKPEEIEKFFGPQIDAAVAAAIKEQKSTLLGAPNASKHRELGVELELALKMLLARIERGVRVELRFIGPPPPPEDEEDPYSDIRGVAEDLRGICRNLEFAKIEHEPVLSLTYSDGEPDEQGEPEEKE